MDWEGQPNDHRDRGASSLLIAVTPGIALTWFVWGWMLIARVSLEHFDGGGVAAILFAPVVISISLLGMGFYLGLPAIALRRGIGRGATGFLCVGGLCLLMTAPFPLLFFVTIPCAAMVAVDGRRSSEPGAPLRGIDIVLSVVITLITWTLTWVALIAHYPQWIR